jgi:hypothetical protein
MVLCTRSLLFRGPNGYARAIQEGDQARRGDPITRTHRACFARRLVAAVSARIERPPAFDRQQAGFVRH